jgi:hypothetical protein
MEHVHLTRYGPGNAVLLGACRLHESKDWMAVCVFEVG